jgi:hypothetical protein
MNVINVLTMAIIAGSVFLLGNFVYVYAQNTTSTAPQVYSQSLEIWVGLIIAVAALGKTIVDKFHINTKVGQVFTVVGDQGKEILRNKETIKQGMETVYQMLPEESQEIINKPLVKVAELNAQVEKQRDKLQIVNTLVDKFGKPVEPA